MRFPLVSEGELLSSPPPEFPRQLVRKYKLEKSRKGTGIGEKDERTKLVLWAESPLVLCERTWLVLWADFLGEERLMKF